MLCDECQLDASVYSRRLTKGGFKTLCRSCLSPRTRPSCYNAFAELSLDHVRDANDRPVRVTSLRQLREVEKQHRCLSAVANLDAAHVDEPPQHKPGSAFKTMTDENRWLYPEVAQEMLKDMQESGEIF
jgi:hypothetical protein